MNGSTTLSQAVADCRLNLGRVGNVLRPRAGQVQRATVVALVCLTVLFLAKPGVSAAQPASPAPEGSLSGVAYVDSNGNGRRDPNETLRIAGVPVGVSDASSSWVVITLTAADGSYAVADLPAGLYTVTALPDPAMGLIPTSPTIHQVILTATGTLRNLDFGFLMTNAVHFNDAGAVRRSGGIHVTWSTSLEVGNDGFVVYRAPSPVGPYERLNAQLIPAASIGGGGAEYEFIDEAVVRGASYYYTIEAEPGLQNSGPWPTISFRYLPVIRRLPTAGNAGYPPS